MKRVVKAIILVFIFIFIGLYFFYNNGYKESLIKKEQMLMEEKVIEYENDLKNGVDVSLKDYSIKKVDYSNNYTDVNLKMASFIEDMLHTSIKFVFKKMNNFVNS